jgi:hypothetical protein
MRKLVIALLVIVGLFVAADRIGAVVADHEVASRVATAYDLPSEPSVSIQGFPFLTQAASGNYKQIDVSMASVSSDGVEIHNLDARFSGVHAPLSAILSHDPAGITADQVSASGTIPYSAVQSRVPAGVQVSPDGSDLKLSGTVTSLGVSVPVSVIASLSVGGSGIVVTPRHFTAGGDFSLPVSLVASHFGFLIPVTGLPLHLSVTSVGVTPGGVRVSAAARGVQFAGTA